MLLVDGNSLGFTATAVNDLKSGSMQTGGVYGFLQTLRAARADFPGQMRVLWDGRSWRYEHYPDYKGNRAKVPALVALKQSWKAQKPYVAKLLTHLGVSQMFASNMEADDLAAKIVYAVPGSHTLITSDKDWCQLVSDRVTWFDPKYKRFCSPSNLKDIVGYNTVADFIQAKALTGDTSDNIKGVGRIGDGYAGLIFERFGSVEGLLSHKGEFPNKPIRDFAESEEKQQKYRDNLKLVKLHPSVIPPSENLVIVKGRKNKEAFSDTCAELAFNKFLRDADEWLDFFEKNND